MLSGIIEVLVPATLSFIIGMLLTPVLTHYLYLHKAWKKKPGKQGLDGAIAHEFNRLHVENEMRAPRMGGIVVWGSVFLTTVGIALAAAAFPVPSLTRFNFLTRSETWLPLATMLVGAIAGFFDDLLVIRASSG